MCPFLVLPEGLRMVIFTLPEGLRMVIFTLPEGGKGSFSGPPGGWKR